MPAVKRFGTTFKVSLSPELLEAMEDAAASDGESAAAFVRRAITEALSKRGISVPPPPRKPAKRARR